MLIKISEITPVTDYGRETCPYNCAECSYFRGLLCDEIDCGLEEEPEQEKSRIIEL